MALIKSTIQGFVEEKTLNEIKTMNYAALRSHLLTREALPAVLQSVEEELLKTKPDVDQTAIRKIAKESGYSIYVNQVAAQLQVSNGLKVSANEHAALKTIAGYMKTYLELQERETKLQEDLAKSKPQAPKVFVESTNDEQLQSVRSRIARLVEENNNLRNTRQQNDWVIKRNRDFRQKATIPVSFGFTLSVVIGVFIVALTGFLPLLVVLGLALLFGASFLSIFLTKHSKDTSLLKMNKNINAKIYANEKLIDLLGKEITDSPMNDLSNLSSESADIDAQKKELSDLQESMRQTLVKAENVVCANGNANSFFNSSDSVVHEVEETFIPPHKTWVENKAYLPM